MYFSTFIRCVLQVLLSPPYPCISEKFLQDILEVPLASSTPSWSAWVSSVDRSWGYHRCWGRSVFFCFFFNGFTPWTFYFLKYPTYQNSVLAFQRLHLVVFGWGCGKMLLDRNVILNIFISYVNLAWGLKQRSLSETTEGKKRTTWGLFTGDMWRHF